VFAQVCVGERIWFDDGRIGGVIRRVEPDGVEVEITHARDSGEKLAGDKGINLPDSQLSLPALTYKDIADLAVATKVADMVGLSFVQQAADVEALRVALAGTRQAQPRHRAQDRNTSRVRESARTAVCGHGRPGGRHHDRAGRPGGGMWLRTAR
jgi:hypothetical protein